MHTERWRTIFAASIFVIGAAFLLWKMWPSPAPSRERRPPTADAPVLALAALRAHAAHDASEILAERIRAADVEGAVAGEVTTAQVSALADAAAARLSLLVEPDYDLFMAYCERHTGRGPPVGAAGAEAARAEWLNGSAFYKGIQTDPHDARVVLRSSKGRLMREPQGRFTTITPVGGYGRLSDPAEQRFTAIDVYVPVEGKDARTMAPLRLYYVMRFGWDERRQSWQPLQQGMCDPENREAALLPPPI